MTSFSSKKGIETRSLRKRALTGTKPKRRNSLFSFVMVSICGCFWAWNNLALGGRLIRSSFVFPEDNPAERWNGGTTNKTTRVFQEGEGLGNMDLNRKAGLRATTAASGGTNTMTADPFSLKKGVESFIKDDRRPRRTSGGVGFGDGVLWDLFEHYPPPFMSSPAGEREKGGEDDTNRPFYYYEHDKLSPELVCGAGPGRGMEQDGGYKLLVEKIRVLAAPDDATQRTTAKTTNTSTTTTEPKLLCLVYTYSPMRYLLKTQALVWGQHCDGFLAFSNETLPELGIYELPIDQNQQQDDRREESYNNMWQKSRGIWKYVHDHFLEQFDYFYLSGDDVYLLVNNLRAYLREGLEPIDASDPKPRHFGSWLPSRSMVAGGPGYVLNRAALQRYTGTTEVNIKNDNITNNAAAASSSTSVWSTCLAHTHRSYEDRYLSECLSKNLGIFGNDTDTRDPSTGEQRFHDTDPATLYLFRAAQHAEHSKSSSYLSRMAKTWEDQPMPSGWGNTATANTSSATTATSRQMLVGPKHGLEAAAKHTISLHRIFTPTYMARIHAILHPATCPIDSPLGKGRKRHYLFMPETT